ncbi:unnamed protein product [Symbiodinium sp. CCMP2592]|nr:unnamed protein product [Symbiodinium sp. CCMP2592]
MSEKGPGAFSTLDVVFPWISSQPLQKLPHNMYHVRSIDFTCKQILQISRSPAPPREVVAIESKFLSMLVFSSSAMEHYNSSVLAAQHAHLDCWFVKMKNESSFTGLLPHVWGINPENDAVPVCWGDSVQQLRTAQVFFLRT